MPRVKRDDDASSDGKSQQVGSSPPSSKQLKATLEQTAQSRNAEATIKFSVASRHNRNTDNTASKKSKKFELRSNSSENILIHEERTKVWPLPA